MLAGVWDFSEALPLLLCLFLLKQMHFFFFSIFGGSQKSPAPSSANVHLQNDGCAKKWDLPHEQQLLVQVVTCTYACCLHVGLLIAYLCATDPFLLPPMPAAFQRSVG